MRYFLSFIEEGIFNPKYETWVGGRVEVFIDTQQYNIEEIRFFTKRTKEWNDFREQWDFKDVTEKQLIELRKTIKKKYYIIVK